MWLLSMAHREVTHSYPRKKMCVYWVYVHMSPHTAYTFCALHSVGLAWITDTIVTLVDVSYMSPASLVQKKNA